MDSSAIIYDLFNAFEEVRYAAIYIDGDLVFKQKGSVENSSGGSTDTYEELLVNPGLLTLARQRGNIDCGGLRYLIVGYGNFYQLVKEIRNGHVSVCVEKEADLNNLPDEIFKYLDDRLNQA